MKIIACALLMIICSTTITAQKKNTSAANDFDFWIGEWQTEASLPPKWKITPGIDSVRYLLDGTLIDEVFTNKRVLTFKEAIYTI